MSLKVPLASGESFYFYHEGIDDQLNEVFIELTNPDTLKIEREGMAPLTAALGIPADVMDQIAIAWIKERKLQGTLGGPVGKEFGSPDSGYE